MQLDVLYKHVQNYVQFCLWYFFGVYIVCPFFLKEFFGNWSYLEKDSGFFFINIYLTEYLT